MYLPSILLTKHLEKMESRKQLLETNMLWATVGIIHNIIEMPQIHW